MIPSKFNRMGISLAENGSQSEPEIPYPEGYRQVEYLANYTGTEGACCELGEYSTNGTAVEADIKSEQDRTTPLFCYRYYLGNAVNASFGLWFTADYGGLNYRAHDPGVLTVFDHRRERHTFKFGTGCRVLMDGTQIYYSSQGTLSTGLVPLVLGRVVYYENRVDTRTFKGRIYGFKLWQDGVLKVNLVPCVRLSDELTGFYDTEKNIFRPSITAVRYLTPEECEN